MKKKILYIIGGIIGFFVLIVIIAPSSPPPQNTEQPQQESAAVEISTEMPESNVAPDQAAEQGKNQPSNNQLGQQTEQKQAVVESTKSSAPTTSQYTYYSVVSVVDGDTIKINLNGTTETLRLIGIDTPETVDPRKPVQCFGKEASNKAKELLSGQKVRIEKDSTQGDRDKYGRLLVYVWREDGLFFNEYMVKQGYAHEYTYDTPYKYQAQFKSDEIYARTNQLGLWSPDTCNGDTTSEATPLSQTTTQTSGKYYTSSYYTSKYYYPEACSSWQSLSSDYLKAFDSLEALLSVYPSRTLSPQCQ